jgi:hypothetical protein
LRLASSSCLLPAHPEQCRQRLQVGQTVIVADLEQNRRAVGVPAVPPGFDGLVCFSFLNRFTYGNFGDPSQFGLEC